MNAWAAVLLTTIIAGVGQPGSLPPADQSLSVTLKNRTGVLIRRIYITPVDREDWGYMLNRDNLSIRGSIEIRVLRDGCRYDIRATLDSGRYERQLMNVDLCETRTVTLGRKNTRFVERPAGY